MFIPYGQTSGFQPLNQQPAPQQPTGVLGKLREFSTGIAKGELSTLRGIGTVGEKALNQSVGRLVNIFGGRGNVPTVSDTVLNRSSVAGQRATELLTPKTGAEKAGFAVEQIAEFFLPASKIAKAEKFVNVLSSGIKSTKLAAATRIGGKALASAIPTATIATAQTGSIKEGLKAGVTAGAIRGSFATIGEGARALKIPERLYSTIFKLSKRDMRAELSANGILNLQQNNPAKYEELVRAGIIKTSGGQPIVNNTLAEQALDRGLRGSIRNMANEVVSGTLDSEYQIQTIVKNYPNTIPVKETQYQTVLQKIAQSYKDVGFGEVATEADYLASKLASTKGNIDANTLLQMRRFFDRMRIASSYEKGVTDLSMSQGNLKVLSDALRTKLNAIPNVGSIMKDYSFYIDAMGALAREASRRGNNQVISLIDSVFLTGGLSSGSTAPVATIMMLRRMLLSGQGVSSLGQLLSRSTIKPATAGILGASSNLLSSQINPQEQSR